MAQQWSGGEWARLATTGAIVLPFPFPITISPSQETDEFRHSEGSGQIWESLETATEAVTAPYRQCDCMDSA